MATVLWKSVAAVQTAAVVRWDRRHLRNCDPYLVWADASTRPPSDDRKPNIAVLVELVKDETVQDLFGRFNPPGGTVRMVPNQLGNTYQTSFITALVSREGLLELIREVQIGEILRFTLQGSRTDLSSTTVSLYGLHLRYPPLAAAQALPAGKASKTPSGEYSTYLGILDDGLPFLRVRDAVQLFGQPAHLWDQGWMYEGLAFNPDNPTGASPDQNDHYWDLAALSVVLPIPVIGTDATIPMLVPHEGFLYGRRSKKLPTQEVQPKVDRDEYLASRYVHPAPRETHGASVLSLMAPWISSRRGDVQWPKHIAGLAMVQLPTITVDDTSGGSLAMRVLDGIRYVLWQEFRDRDAPNAPARPTVVNVSYGVHGGPHDGTSMFERAAHEALDKNPHLHLVLPMGNAHRAGIHARHVLRAKGHRHDQMTLKVRVMPDNPRDTFVEIWLPDGAEVDIEIMPPGQPSVRLRQGEARVAYEPDREDPLVPRIVRFAGVYPSRSANSTSGTMVLVAIGATRPRFPQAATGRLPNTFEPVGANQQFRRTVIATPGEWHVKVRNRVKKVCEFNAWIERDDAAPDRAAGARQARFPDSAVLPTGQDEPRGTVNGIATFKVKHRQLHVIGAMRSDGRLSVYSAARAEGSAAQPPNAVTVADWSAAIAGIRTLGFTEGAMTRLNGTSASCAVYSRALAEALANGSGVPKGPSPGFIPPEFDSGPEDEPSAPDALRGEAVRISLPFDVE